MWVELSPWLTAMVVLIGCSAFFSASEAAMFYLRGQDRHILAAGSAAQRLAADLLQEPDRLLSAVLFWNLTVNITYFAIASIVALQIEDTSPSMAAIFAAGSLLAIIFFSEMVPKSLSVLSARRLAAVFAVPLAAAVRAVDPLIPALRVTTLLSQRLVWPRFRPEPYLDISDLERAIALSTTDAQLIEQEQAALGNIILLSDIRVDEWMRPRKQFLVFRPPVSLDQLQGRMTPSGYLLIAEPDSEEVAAAVHLKDLATVPSDHLEHYAEQVVYVPWCTTVADALQAMHDRGREVAAVVNEFGETIGILTYEDVLDTVLSYHPTRDRRLMDRDAVQPVREGVWHISGLTSLRRLARFFQVDLPPSKSVTTAGVIQEKLQRLAREGDECDWGPFHFRVLPAPKRGHVLVELTLHEPEGPAD